jgi:SAM-dependent methyltransferase
VRNVPADYYSQLAESEDRHWWYAGVRSIAGALLGERLRRGGSLLDAGCGTGGYLRWARELGTFDRLAGVDVSAEAVAAAKRLAPEAELQVGSVRELPFPDDSFDLVLLNDVIQHVHEDELDAALAELRRVLRPAGAMLVRTNGALRPRRARADWRTYSAASLRDDLARAGFAVERLTHANMLLSTWPISRGRSPRPPTADRHGLPLPGGGLKAHVGAAVLGLEARYLQRSRSRLPYGHTLFAVATVP